ncbi:lipoyl synthase [candidate division KSB1 bacterium 4572_119]|nr:MAG: lipoyl synthase [candidate division KSB1 bacterium 4572_119]
MRIREKRHPKWMKVPLPVGSGFNEVKRLVKDNQLHTVCQSAHCPNIGECWGQGTATFMILGDICTRNCRFCAVTSGKPGSVDFDEPKRVAEAVKTLSLKYAVITSVTRDDLPDGGSSIFASVINKIREQTPDCRIEVLIPDFLGSQKSLEQVFLARPDVLNHNLETVPSLYSEVRPAASYSRSLQVLHLAKQNGLISKSGIMLGLGETHEEVIQVMRDLRKVNCDFLTLGQYLQPSASHLPIEKYIEPDEFVQLKEEGMALGFKHIESGPLVRSSYHAAIGFDECDRSEMEN